MKLGYTEVRRDSEFIYFFKQRWKISEIFHAASGKSLTLLSWTHYRTLLQVNDIARYSVMNGSEQLFASKYKLYLPTEEELHAEIEVQKATFYLQLKGTSETSGLEVIKWLQLLKWLNIVGGGIYLLLGNGDYHHSPAFYWLESFFISP